WNKGEAVKWIAAHVHQPKALVVFVGGDPTDEDAFAALPDGVTIRVGPAVETAAKYHLDGPDGVRKFLGWLREHARPRRPGAYPSRDSMPDPHADWYKDAIFYEVSVRGFFDSNADGYGDLRGLTEKLDYLRDLGVDCIWLMPIYPSPLKDDGYDIADFYGIHPTLGAVEEFAALTAAAHERGMRVIADLALTHTSDQHPWFQEARKDPNSPHRDFYVWSDTDQKYQGVRIIFKDTEQSNWAWDPVARKYYFHRFFS